ncbi:ALP1-like protein [Tanacetum coccineum]
MICRFHCSGETISRCFARVCNAVIRLHPRLLEKLEPVPDNSMDQILKWFKNCLGALDGTNIKCLVPLEDKPRHRTRKNDIATNILGVCSQDMQFIYFLAGWEGLAADDRVLRDALNRPQGLKVPRPCYYLVDVGYTNEEGFPAPYKGQMYHLNEWRDGHQPTTAKEFYNMKHSSARNVIERSFGILKARWGILKDNSFDPLENESESDEGAEDHEVAQEDDNITHVGTSNEWTSFRDNLAQSMFGSWNANT